MTNHEMERGRSPRLRGVLARLLLLITAVLAVSSATASAQTWDLAHDFPVSSDGTTPPANPSGAWGIGYGVSSYTHGPAMASFRLAPSTDWENGVPAGQTPAQGWADQQPDANSGGSVNYYPYLAKNTSGGDAFSGIWPDGAVEGHPGADVSSEDRTAVAWISPITGTVSISASLVSVNSCSAGLDYSVDVQPNGGALARVAGGFFPALGAGTYGASAVSVHSGDRYYFSVGDGNTGSILCDSTEFSIVISTATGGTGGAVVWHNNITGSGAQTLNHPEGVSLNSNDHPASLVIADSGNNRVETSDPFGTSMSTFDGASLSDPRQAILNNGNFIIGDTNHGQVRQIVQSGNTDGGTFGTSNSQPMSYGFPRGVAQNGDGSEIAVADAGHNAVYVFGSSGNLLRTLTTDGTKALKSPEGVAFDGSNNVWVADTQNHRLVEFSGQNGSVLKTISPSNSFDPTGISVDPYSGNIWVAAWGNGNVVELDRAGQLLQTITSANGSGDQLNGPVTLAFDPSSGDLYVADTSNSRIVHYTGAGQPPVVNTDGVISTSASDLTVQGRVNPEGRASTYYVQYGADQSSMTSYQPAQAQSLADSGSNPYTDTSDHTLDITLSGLSSGQNYCYRFVAFNPMGPAYGATKCQNTVAPPVVGTSGAFSISADDLGVQGTINPQGTPSLKYYFQLGVDQAHMTTYQPAPPPGTSVGFSDSTPHTFQVHFGNLSAGKSYCFQLVATDGVSTYPGGVKCHMTVGRPTVSTDGVFYQDTDRLGVQGTITPNGDPNLSYYVEYGTSPSNLNAFYPSQTGTPLGYSDFSGHIVQVYVKPLKAGTQYCLQLVATDGPETVKGGVVCHATTGSPVPLLTTSTPTCSQQQCDWNEDYVNLSGAVNPDGAPASWYFQISPCRNFQYSNCPASQQVTLSFPSNDHGQHPNPQALNDTGYSPHIVSTQATGLTPGTTYYIRLVATNTNTSQSAFDTKIQSVTTSHLVLAVNYLGSDGLFHPFTTSPPTFDQNSVGIPWNYSCTEVGQPSQGAQFCGYYLGGQGPKHDTINLPATCAGPAKCTYTVKVHGLGTTGRYALDAIYQYVVNPPPPPPVQHKANTTANGQITQQTEPQCGLFDIVCQGKKLVGGVVQIGKAGIDLAIKGANDALRFLHDFGQQVNSLADSARRFLGLLLAKLTFQGRPVGVQFGFDQYGNRYVTAAPGYHFITGTVANVVGAGAGNIIGARAGNARDVSGAARDRQSAGQQAYLKGTGDAIQYAVINDQTGRVSDVVGAGAGNVLSVFEVVGAGAGNFAANLFASFSSWFHNPVVGAGAGNVVGAGAGNVIGAGAGNIIGKKGLNVVGAGAGNVVGAGAGNAGDVSAARASWASAGAGLSYGDTPESFSEIAGTAVTSTITITPVGGRATILAAGTTYFRMTGKQTVWLAYTKAGAGLLTQIGQQNASRAKKHQPLQKLNFTVVNQFKPARGKAKTFTHSYAFTPKGS